ncbi:MAG: hypothetical protein Q8O56_09615 [Solirubrobacteraceae bacterium]|nr:hypothetical protein [Solirubrobacteraceae bacterium]
MSHLLPFRNRLAHHETIIRRPIARHRDAMLDLARLVDPNARDWIAAVSRIDDVLAQHPTPY